MEKIIINKSFVFLVGVVLAMGFAAAGSIYSEFDDVSLDTDYTSLADVSSGYVAPAEINPIVIQPASLEIIIEPFPIDPAVPNVEPASVEPEPVPASSQPPAQNQNGGGGGSNNDDDEGGNNPALRNTINLSNTNAQNDASDEELTTSQNNEEPKSGLSRITGAVIGAFGDAGAGGIIMIVLIIGLTAILIYNKRKPAPVAEPSREKTSKK